MNLSLKILCVILMGGSLIAEPVITPVKKFNDKDIQSGEYVLKKDQIRKLIIEGFKNQDMITIMSSPLANDQVEDLVSVRPLLLSLQEIEDKGLKKAQLEKQPWSDDYWAIYSGGLGKRYADKDFPFSSDWKANSSYIDENPSTQIFTRADVKAIDDLSPSEKYDLLMSTEIPMLTNNMWGEGKYYYEEYGKVESWMGICHGWAPASYNLERPLNKVTVIAADGVTPITFYPADIKALASLLWAKAMPRVKFIGGRCQDKEPETDDNGRLTSPDCFDVNPMTWHLSVVNQIGVAQKSFVLDATYDYEVWNQPVVSYDYDYYNPITFDTVDTLEEAMVKIGDLTVDPFKEYRDSRTKYLVGIQMVVRYMVEVVPQQMDVDAPKYDYRDQVSYTYDLELDENKKLIGGEWHDSIHPDFLWTPNDNVRALSVGDYYIANESQWSGDKLMPETWRNAAEMSSIRGTPLAKVVERLIELSRKEREENISSEIELEL